MKTWDVIEVESGAHVYQYASPAALELAAWPAPAYRQQEADASPIVEALKPLQIWDRIDFLKRIRPEERIAARTAAKSDPQVEDVLALLDGTPRVRNDDPDTHMGLQLLTLKGCLAPGRMDEILYG